MPSKEAPELSWCPQGLQWGWGHFFLPSPACWCVSWRPACAQPLNMLDTQGHWESEAAAGPGSGEGLLWQSLARWPWQWENTDEQQPQGRSQRSGCWTRHCAQVAVWPSTGHIAFLGLNCLISG